MKIPLAWLQLSRERMRLVVALAGIAFADILMFMQLGFKDALFDSTTVLQKSFSGEVFIISPQTDSSIGFKSFSRRRLYQSLGIAGVDEVIPVYFQAAAWKNPVNRQTRNLGVFGFNPTQNAFNLPGLAENLDLIKLKDVVLFDSLSRPEFGPIPQLLAEGKPVTAEVESRQVTIGGLFTMGASFAADGWLITSDLNFLRIFSKREQGLIELGIIVLEPSAEIDTVVRSLRAKLPADVIVLTREEFITLEKTYWQNSTAIGFIFNFGTIIGFIVGIVIVYQILYTDVTDHLPEYATLKAMGYKDQYFVSLVFQEALILAFLGFIPGFLISNLLYYGAASGASLPIMMTLNKAVTVLILTVIMCCLSGLIAVRKLAAADPADIF
ncbi:ABC transporter permease DevC [Gloeocapsa sp. PCC 73106]|uniref:ABC transporter permease DevC n=1 Tax=Gloeocapsa sp. PCC 73106 TaxID=102232 RepID=UPI0002ABE4C6|nr:ABC transporter permease DevC [Gloeocapsa sp. PCC 73106]ELR98422.1 DevC protein [Gloeocapsa sp. PCC 73106]